MKAKLEMFWKRWQTEYLQLLRKRPATKSFQNKNTIINKEPATGDVVIIHKKLTKRATWKLGKITKLLPSEPDGKIRAAAVQVPSGNIQFRLLKELYYLKLNKADDQQLMEQAEHPQHTPARNT